MATLSAVVIGSGALGASVAYHLARRGAEVALVEQHALGSQTSPRAAGLTNTKAVSQPIMVRLQDEATETLATFERDTGRSVGFVRSGSLKAAYTEAGERKLTKDVETARARGIEVRAIAPSEAERLAPWFVVGASRALAHVPSDGYLDPATLPIAYIQLAQQAGARIVPFTRVTDVLRANGKVAGVATTLGDMRADVVVDAAGAWTVLVAANAGITVPLVPVRHQLFITEPLTGVQPQHPVVRLIEASVYVRHERGGLMVGGYEDAPRVVDAAALPTGFQMADLELDIGVLRSLVEEVADHFPLLRDAPVAIHRGGLPTMTPDGMPILGAVHGADGFYVASGCCVGGLSLSPAAGRALADLILDGRSEPDLSPLSVERFRAFANDPAALTAAGVDHYARKYMK